eukprot:973248_1
MSISSQINNETRFMVYSSSAAHPKTRSRCAWIKSVVRFLMACIGIVDGDTNDKSDGFHFGDRECYGFRSDGVQYTNGKLVGKWDKYCSGDSLALLVYNNTIQWLVNNVIKCIQYNIVPSRKYRLAVSMCGRNNSVTVLSASKIENAQTVLKKKKKNKKKKKKQKKKKKKKKLQSLQPQISINVPFGKGDKYILLDVGGGTCDVACHEVVGEFAIAEVLHPSGGKWGATYIDEKFIKLLSELFTKDLLNIFQMNAIKGRQSYLKLLNYFLNEAKISYYANNDEDQVITYHDIQMPSNFVIFVITQFMTDFTEGVDTLDVAAGLIKLNKRLQSLTKKYQKPDTDIPPKADASKYIANPTDDDEGTNNNPDVNKDKYKDRDWMVKIIERDDDDEEHEEDYLLSMHNDVWENLFNTIVNPIIKHCKKILTKPQMKDAKYLFLVGGFANSKYFQM